MDLSKLDHIFREDYKQGTLSLTNIHENPFEQFKLWFDDIVELQQKQPNAMVLSTVSEQGLPESRIVLLKHLSEKGFCFFSNYKSAKGKSIDCNPVVALLFYNIELERQIHVHGSIEKLSYKESNSYFKSRPFGSQVSALASQQSAEVPSRSYLENQVTDLLKQHHQQSLECPDFWGGYRVIPHYYEFWQGRPSRLHDRICYEKQPNNSKDTWRLYRKSP